MPATPRLLRRAVSVAAMLAAVVGAGSLPACTGERPHLADEPSPTTTEPPATTTTAATSAGPEVAQAKESSIEVYATADAAAAERQIASGVDTSLATIPIVFLVKDREPDAGRIEVYLPVSPTGSTGWVDASDVTLANMPYRIEVGGSDHRLRIFRDEEMILDEPASVDPDELPDPGGIYYVKELLEPPSPDTAYGAYAYGLSGYSNVLEGIEDGATVIGIHGTNDPDTVGTDVSSGCIGLLNDAIVRMVEDIGLPLGTPVEIQA